jgi:hypothetical protein
MWGQVRPHCDKTQSVTPERVDHSNHVPYFEGRDTIASFDQYCIVCASPTCGKISVMTVYSIPVSSRGGTILKPLHVWQLIPKGVADHRRCSASICPTSSTPQDSSGRWHLGAPCP